jgi:hypothetical protein
MAILKHVASKNASYGSAEDYLRYAHDEKGKPVLDESGHKIERENLQIVGLNCNVDTWTVECLEANKKYQVNNAMKDIKRHEYIISYEPKDLQRGLTPDQALQNGIEFANKYFPGHQTIIAVHQDGSQKSGNIHVHIDINSVRIKEQEQLPYMNRHSDYAEGMKHRCSAAFMHQAKKYVMEQSQEQVLNQKELLYPAQDKISNKEYWVQKRGQERENKIALEEGKPPTKFDTDLEEVRQVVKVCSSRNRLPNGNLDEKKYQADLKENFGIEVTESRGRFSYMHPRWIEEGRQKPVSDRKLGAEYERSNLSNGIDRQQDRATGNRFNQRNHSQARDLAQSILDQARAYTAGTKEEEHGRDLPGSNDKSYGRERDQAVTGSGNYAPGRIGEEVRRADEAINRHSIQGRDRYHQIRERLTDELQSIRGELQQNRPELRELKFGREEVLHRLSECNERKNKLSHAIERQARQERPSRSQTMEW